MVFSVTLHQRFEPRSGGRVQWRPRSSTQTGRLNDINLEAYLADIIGRIADHPASRIDVLPPVEPAAINADQRRHNVRSKGLLWETSGIAPALRRARTAGSSEVKRLERQCKLRGAYNLKSPLAPDDLERAEKLQRLRLRCTAFSI